MIEATTDAMCLSSHGGLLVLRQEEEHLALASQLSSIITASGTSADHWISWNPNRFAWHQGKAPACPYLAKSPSNFTWQHRFRGKNAILHHKITRVKYFSTKNRQVKRSMKYSG